MGCVAIFACGPLGTRLALLPAYVAMTFLLHTPHVGVQLPGVHAPAAVHVLVRRGDHTPASDAMAQDRFRGGRSGLRF